MLRQEMEAGADAVVMIDDDMAGMFYYENGKKIYKLETGHFIPFIEKYSLMTKDIGAYLWGVNVNQDPQNYKECTPFSTVSYIGGPFGCFLKGNNCFYDESLPLKEDYDMTIQQLHKNRVALRVNKYFYRVKQSEQAGGCASYRNIAAEKEQLELLRKKWGARIVKYDNNTDRSNKSKKGRKEVFFDYNPIIRVPIKGV